MKRLFTLFFTLLSIVTFAQPTITSSVAGGIGDNFSSTYVETEDFDPGAAGAGVTWDFSGITTSGTLNEYSFVDPSTTGHAAEFPGANVASEADGNYVYFKISPSEYTLFGVWVPTTTIYYSDPEELYVFPMTYGTTNSDDLYSEFYSGGDFIRSGSNELNADGYGTLILPSGTYTNVLRVKIEQDYSDEFVGLPFTFIYNFDLYYWFKEGVKGPLFQYFYQDINSAGIPSVVENYAINNDVDITSINDDPSSILLNIFPNPANEYINISVATNVLLLTAELFDVTGKKVIENTVIASGNNVTINVSDLSSGVYIVRLLTSEGIYSKNITIQ